MRSLRIGLVVLAAPLFLSVQVKTSAQGDAASAGRSPATSSQRQFLDRYCATCHNERLKTGGLSLDQVDVSRPGAQPELWEKVVRKLHTGVMPPPNVPQPPKADRLAMLTWLETSLDAAAAAKPNPGRTETLRRLNRTEYQNAIRDLLALDIDAASLLPADESGHGFDNVIVGDLSPTLLDRYISAAQKISRLAVGSTQSSLQSDTFLLPADLTQEDHLPGLPIGTRGGMSRSYTFAQDGEYDIQILLARDLAGIVSGLREDRPHELLVLLDREPVATFTVQKPANDDDTLLDKDLKVRVAVHAGPHNIGVTFVKVGSSLIDTARQPTESRFNDRRHPRTAPAISQVSVTGPYAPKGVEDTPSRRRLFVCRPTGQDTEQEEKCAGTILSTLMRRAYRRPIANAEVAGPMAFYREGARRRRFRRRNRRGAECRAHQPGVPVPRGKRPEESRGERCLPNQRSRAGIAIVVFPVEQHPGRRAARRRRSGQAESARRAREAGAPDARRSALVQPRDEFRRTVAAAAQYRCGQSKRLSLSGLRRQPATSLPAGNRALLRQRAARGSQRAHVHQGGLHVPQ